MGEAGRSWASQLAFAWVTPLMSLGSRRRLQHDDLLDLPPELHPAECRRVMWGQWKQVCTASPASNARSINLSRRPHAHL